MDFWTAATNFGVAVACLAVMGIAIWRSVVWLGNNVIKPVAQRHVKFLDDLSIAITSISTAMQSMSSTITGMSVRQESTSTTTSDMAEKMDSTVEGMRSVLEKLDLLQDTVNSYGDRIDGAQGKLSKGHEDLTGRLQDGLREVKDDLTSQIQQASSQIQEVLGILRYAPPAAQNDPQRG